MNELTRTEQLVIDKSLAALPRRKTDNAVVIRAQDSKVSQARIFKLNVIIDDPILLERCNHASPIMNKTLTPEKIRGPRKTISIHVHTMFAPYWIPNNSSSRQIRALCVYTTGRANANAGTSSLRCL